MELKGKTVLITGGTAGIGLEAAKQFLAAGSKVIITGRDQLKLDRAQKLHPELIAIKSDVANEEDAKSLYNQIKTLGGIDILYNNAGVLSISANMGAPSDRHLTEAEYEMSINYFGVIRLNNLFMDILASRKEGAIINTTSLLAYVPSAAEATYSASKVALRFYTETLRKHLELLNSNVKVFELLPPVVNTEMATSRNDMKITPDKLVKALIAGLSKNQFTIRVGNTKLLYIVNRLFPKVAFGLVNSAKSLNHLRPNSQ
ncbi:SDR family NAD(P)-dependent oxidoreductase [uncultured Acetobacteroides sp.]|uniref:SDR family oxidoreductase n=1 Tax=uncultured Acetobacteroides sp. TaxID=1760811 RepID=UPI0029F584B6|nr:SDR family NAD(P)-dependent oxidoreductase [uncultured Acetobacteroides sp.]